MVAKLNQTSLTIGSINGNLLNVSDALRARRTMLIRARRRRKTYPKRLAARLFHQALEAGLPPDKAATLANANLKLRSKPNA